MAFTYRSFISNQITLKIFTVHGLGLFGPFEYRINFRQAGSEGRNVSNVWYPNPRTRTHSRDTTERERSYQTVPFTTIKTNLKCLTKLLPCQWSQPLIWENNRLPRDQKENQQ